MKSPGNTGPDRSTTPASRLRALPVPSRMNSLLAVLLLILYAGICLALIVILSGFLKWYYLVQISIVLIVVWSAYFNRPFREAVTRGRDFARLADILDSSNPCILLLRPFRDESNLANATPAPFSLGNIKPSLTGIYKKLRLEIGDEIKIFGLKNDFSGVDDEGVDMILVPHKQWQETVSIAAEGADKIILCMSTTGSGDGLLWELDLLEGDPELRAKTILFAQPHGWLAAYQKVKASHEVSVNPQTSLIHHTLYPRWNRHKVDINNWPGSPDKWKSEDEHFWSEIRKKYPRLSEGLVQDVGTLADNVKNELL